jgi:glycosyltransferase involved in cell wall biosynthesis
VTPRVTVGLPFFDEERHLAVAIRSVLRQSVRDLEVILVDDGSTDRSLSIARALAAGDGRVRVLSDGVRRGLPARLNELARLARAPCLARMDGDDVMHPERLAVQLSRLDADSGLDAVGTWAAMINDAEDIFGISASPEPRRVGAEILARGILAHATMTARTEWLRANVYDESLTRAEDRDLWCRVGFTARLSVVPEVLYVVRVTTNEARFLPDYLAGQAQYRSVVLRHGPALAGWRTTARIVASSAVKSAAMQVLHATGLASRVVRGRGRAPTAADRLRVREALAHARDA